GVLDAFRKIATVVKNVV
uniref:Uperin-3.1 n=1 Tax=Uperoleia inundata TaxID=104953 RepID=UPE31_UPEIN|nr:RecName: Full=Uperin-3.1 [Uperoleia inundata]